MTDKAIDMIAYSIWLAVTLTVMAGCLVMAWQLDTVNLGQKIASTGGIVFGFASVHVLVVLIMVGPSD